MHLTHISRSCLRSHKAVVDCDVIAREVVEPGKPALAKIVKAFGDDVLLDVSRMASDPSESKR